MNDLTCPVCGNPGIGVCETCEHRLGELRARVIELIVGPGVRDGRYFPVAPRDGVYLFARDGDGSRLAGLFADVLRRLPARDRAAILVHWRDVDAARHGVVFSPVIELAADAPIDQPAVDVGRGGHSLIFNGRHVRTMTDDEASDLVARALADVRLWAEGLDADDPFGRWDEVRDAFLESWGHYSPECLAGWVDRLFPGEVRLPAATSEIPI